MMRTAVLGTDENCDPTKPRCQLIKPRFEEPVKTALIVYRGFSHSNRGYSDRVTVRCRHTATSSIKTTALKMGEHGGVSAVRF